MNEVGSEIWFISRKQVEIVPCRLVMEEKDFPTMVEMKKEEMRTRYEVMLICLFILLPLSGCIHNPEEEDPFNDNGLFISISRHRFFLWDDPWDNGVHMFVFLNDYTRDNIRINDSFHLGGSLSIQIHSPNGNISYAKPEVQPPLDTTGVEDERIFIGYDLMKLEYEDGNGTCIIPWDEEGNHTIVVIFSYDDSIYCTDSDFLNIGGDPHAYTHYMDEKDVEINDIHVSFVVSWETIPEDTYILIPTLCLEDGTILTPIWEKLEEGKPRNEATGPNKNTSIVDTEFGPAIRYNVTQGNVYDQNGEKRCSFTVPFYIGNANMVFSTWDRMDIRDRFFKGGPGFSIWEEKDCKVSTRTYIDGKAEWIRIYLERRGDMHNGHSWGAFDSYKGITASVGEGGWMRIELQRYSSFPLD